jgi:hypothetical protein
MNSNRDNQPQLRICRRTLSQEVNRERFFSEAKPMKRNPKGILTILITLLLAASILMAPILRTRFTLKILCLIDGDYRREL